MKMKVVLVGGNEPFLACVVYPLFVAAGFDVVVVLDTLEKLRPVVSRVPEGLVVAQLAATDRPEDVVDLFLKLPQVQVAFIVPETWQDPLDQLASLPNFLTYFPASLSWQEIAQWLRDELLVSQDEDRAEQIVLEAQGFTRRAGVALPGLVPAGARRVSGPRRPSLRLGFYGAQGEKSTSVTALQIAQTLARAGKRVALFDATRRGEVHALAGVQPLADPVTLQDLDLTLFLDSPTEAAAAGFDAVIVDGGPQRGTFHAQWMAIERKMVE